MKTDLHLCNIEAWDLHFTCNKFHRETLGIDAEFFSLKEKKQRELSPLLFPKTNALHSIKNLNSINRHWEK
jgi:hypothetical protein